MPPLKDGSNIKYTNKEKSKCLAETFLKNHHISDGLSTNDHISAVDTAVSQFKQQSHPTPPREMITTDVVRSLIKKIKTKKSNRV